MSHPTESFAVDILFLAFGVFIYARAAAHLVKQGGRVKVESFQMPEGLVALILASYLALVLYAGATQKGAGAESVTIKDLIVGSMAFVIFAGGVAAFLKLARKTNLTELFGITRLPVHKIAGWAVCMIAAGLPIIRVASLLTQLSLPKDELSEQSVVMLFRDINARGDFASLGEFAFATIVIAPLCEEFLFRGFFYGVGKRFMGPIPAGILSAFFFAASHSNLTSLAPLFVLALCFTVAYERTGSLLVPMGMHALFNALNLFVIYAQAHGWFHVE